MASTIPPFGQLKAVEYSKLNVEDDDLEFVHETKMPRSRKRKMSVALICLVAGTIIGVATISLARALTPQPQILTCGTTSEEARARGCVMEPMVYGWMPKECYYDDLSSEYHPYEDREWYTTDKFEERVTPEELWAGTREHVYTHKYHTEHCFFLMRKLSRAVDRREKYVDHKSLQVAHADHCSMVITGWREASNSTNDVVLGFYRCIPLPWA
jgi:hypothetical protein